MLRQAICTILLLTLWIGPLHARLQGQEIIDSMLKELPKQKEDTNKVELLGDLCNEMSQTDPDGCIRYGKEGLTLAGKLAWKRGEAALSLSVGIGYKTKADFPKAMEYLQEAVKLSAELGNVRGMAKASVNIGSVYRAMSNATKALEYYTKAQGLFSELHDTIGIATASGNIGNVYCDELHNFPKALEHMHTALKLFEQVGDAKGIARNTYNLGNVYGSMGNYTTAIPFFWRSMKMAEEIGDKQRIMDNLGGIGNVYLQLATGSGPDGKRDESGVDVLNELPRGKYVPLKEIPKGNAALLHGALEFFNKALALAQEAGNVYSALEFNNQLSQAYRAAGSYKKAYEAEATAHALQDSIFSQESKEQIVRLEMKGEYDQLHLADSLKAAEKGKLAAANLQKQRAYTNMGILCVLLLAAFSFFTLRNNRLLAKEKDRSENLLLNILPAEVAEELKGSGSSKARHFDNVTVLFTDFVNFTQAAEKMSPQVLIDELHDCFRMFDEITHKYNIEKIKTIGDAYLAVCGLPLADPQHAENIVRAAIEINAFMQGRIAKLGSERTFAIRIGIHSGSVVAGIVGVRKFAYDIWGDTVNTAARMEQHGEAGRINISETTYDLVKDKFHCEYRGEVEAKGKGVMKMYFVS